MVVFQLSHATTNDESLSPDNVGVQSVDRRSMFNSLSIVLSANELLPAEYKMKVFLMIAFRKLIGREHALSLLMI